MLENVLIFCIVIKKMQNVREMVDVQLMKIDVTYADAQEIGIVKIVEHAQKIQMMKCVRHIKMTKGVQMKDVIGTIAVLVLLQKENLFHALTIKQNIPVLEMFVNKICMV